MRRLLCAAVLLVAVPCCKDALLGAGARDRQASELYFRPNFDSLDPKLREKFAAEGWTDDEIWDELQGQMFSRITARLDRIGASYVTWDHNEPTNIRVQIFRPERRELIREALLMRGRLSYHMPVPVEEARAFFDRIAAEFPDDFTNLVRFQPPHAFVVDVPNLDRFRSVLDRARQREGLYPADRVVLVSAPPGPGESPQYRVYVAEAEPVLDRDSVDSAGALLGLSEALEEGWGLQFYLRERTRERLNPEIERSPTNYLLMVFDGEVICELTARARFTFPSYSPEKARAIAFVIQSGPLPLGLVETSPPDSPKEWVQPSPRERPRRTINYDSPT